MPVSQPVRSQQHDREAKRLCQLISVGGGLFGELGSSDHEGRPGFGVTEMIDVCVKKDLVRAHVVVLKDGGESVVVVGALVTPVAVHRSGRSRESATRAAGAA